MRTVRKITLSVLATAAWLLSGSSVTGFIQPTTTTTIHSSSNVPVLQRFSHSLSPTTQLQMSTTNTMATLTEATTWRIRFVLRGLPTTKGKKVDEIFNVECQFMEEDGYEPPQGYLKQVKVTTGEDGEAEDKQRFQIVESRWQLSEDPNDRKWGLWVWGLFEEPLYPFLLLQLKTDKIPLPGEDGDSIEPLALFAQVTHKREKDIGAVLSRAELKVRQMETVNADLFGVAKADVYEEKTIGQCVFQPLGSED